MSNSLLMNLPDSLVEEQVDILLETPVFRLERILSLGHITPAGEWFDQNQDEWVAVLQGGARLVLEGREVEIVMNPGDTLLLPAHCRHRVAWTAPDQVTVWLALHFLGAEGRAGSP